MLARAWVLGLAIVLTSSSASGAAEATPFELDVILPLTGQAAFAGASEVRALGAIESLVNATGGIKGRLLKFVYHDDATNPQMTIELTNALITTKRPAVILGAGLAVECAAQFPLVQDTGPVTFCFSPSAPLPKRGGYAFMSGPILPEIVPVHLSYFKSHGLRRFAVITTTDTSGQAFDEALDHTLQRPDMRDVTIVAREHFSVSDLSGAAQVARIKAAKPDVLLTTAAGPPFGTLLHGIADGGLDVPVYGSGANFSPAVIKQYTAFLPKELYIYAVRGVIPDPTASGAMKQAQQVYFNALMRGGAAPDYTLVTAWEPAMVIVDALRHVGTDASAQKLHDYLEHLKNYTGILGTYDFTSGNQRGIGGDATALFRWNATTSGWVQVFADRVSGR